MTDRIENYEYLCRLDELKEKLGKRFYINNTDIAIFKIENYVFAVSNICPHQHTAKIFEGFIENECVVCPLHGWTFSLKNGKLPNGSRGLDTYLTKIIDGKVYAKVKEKELNW
jgi:nitrite reductase/ring-hydroxylating ferredoxin subunit